MLAPAHRSISSLPGPTGLPLLGNVLQLDAERLHATFERWHTRYGEPYTMRIGRRRAVVTASPRHIKELLRERPHQLRRVHQIEDVLRELGGHGVFSAEGEEWRKQRRMMAPAFATGPTKVVWPDFRRITDRLRQRWLEQAQTGKPVDVLADLTRFTIDITGRLIFGRDLNTLEKGSDLFRDNINTMFGGLARRISAPFPYWHYLRLPADRRLERATAVVQEELRHLIEAAQAKVGAAGAAVEAETLLEAMVLARDEEDAKVRFSDDEISGNAMTLLLAGEDTTANAMAWILYYLAKDPAAMARLRAEARGVLGGESSLADFADLSRLRYAGAVAREGLRLRSPAPMFLLEPLSDMLLGDIDVPAGTLIVALTRKSDIDQLGPDGGEFRPDRWMEEKSQSQGVHDAKSSLAFGDGPRMCPGRGLALVECALVTTMVAATFDLEVRAEPTERFAFVMQPVGLRLAFAGPSAA